MDGVVMDSVTSASYSALAASDILVHYCTLSLSDIWVTRQECRVGTPYMERNFIDSLPKAKVDQSESSFLQKRHLGYVTGPK